MQKKIEQYFKSKKEVIAAYLFGSYAEDKERHFSDIDFIMTIPENLISRKIGQLSVDILK